MKSTFGLSGVGKQIEKYLGRLNIFSIKDLLFHLPARYQDRSRITPIRGVMVGEEAVIEGVVTQVSYPTKAKTKLLLRLKDETGVMALRFFHVLSFQKDAFKVGAKLRCFGEVRLGPSGREMTHPEFRVVKNEVYHEPYLTPIYPAADGLSQYTLRKLTTNALALLNHDVHFTELLPEKILKDQNWPTLREAIQFIHRPPTKISVDELHNNATKAQQRLVFEELLAHRMSLLHIKKIIQTRTAIALNAAETIAAFVNRLPFQLTNAQMRVIAEIEKDLKNPFPMLRLVQGDVGSGKTIVAACAMLQSVESGCQAVLMAPTELLAEQHYKNFLKWFESLNVKVVYLSGNIKGNARKEILESIAKGDAHIIIGTHALFQEAVKFKCLALTVVDEQHRFGVSQRATLHEKGEVNNHYPHQLIMTATPIPRTLAMSFYADLDCSIIDELPPGRTPIITSVVANAKRPEVVARVRQACQAGKQAYWVCPLIDESEKISAQAAVTTFDELTQMLPNLKIGLVHGRMKQEEKQAAMLAFQKGETHVLVATTVIEVGVDVPNASLMIIENAERLGLSQLHQLRGRVGRGKIESHCVLLYQMPLSEVAKLRLQVMRETTDGFKIAQQDLELRGPGEVLGTKQTGELTFKVADLIRDKSVLPLVHKAAEVIMGEYPSVSEALVKRWLANSLPSLTS